MESNEQQGFNYNQIDAIRQIEMQNIEKCEKFKERVREYVGEIKFKELIAQMDAELEAYTISGVMRHEYTRSNSKSSVTSIDKL